MAKAYEGRMGGVLWAASANDGHHAPCSLSDTRSPHPISICDVMPTLLYAAGTNFFCCIRGIADYALWHRDWLVPIEGKAGVGGFEDHTRPHGAHAAIRHPGGTEIVATGRRPHLTSRPCNMIMQPMELISTERIVETLNAAKVQYLVVGGLAVNAHGYVRMTMDIDLVIGLRPENIIKALHTLSSIGYKTAVPITPEQFADPVNRAQWRDEKNMRVLKLWNDEFPLTPLDIFVYEPFDFDTEYDAAMRVELRKGLEIPVVRLTTLLAMKKEAGRPQDLADIDMLSGGRSLENR